MSAKRSINLSAAAACLIGCGALVSRADTHYVAQGGQTPSGTFTSWDTAASNIQDAINVSTAPGDIVLVSNGVYQVGSGGAPDGTTNRVYIDRAITVRSANNDPTNTIIKGKWASDGNTNGPDAIRCVYMAVNSSLIGFTLTNGATAVGTWGGGVDCVDSTATISNCVAIGNAAGWGGGAGVYGTWYNCALVRNSSDRAGATYGGTFSNCTLTGNTAFGASGVGGTYGGIFYNCTLTSNSAVSGNGGGTYASTMYSCMLIGNSAMDGGGTYGSQMFSCTLTNNTASHEGGGTYGGVLTNCTLTANTAAFGGGGGLGGTMYDCRLIGNSVTGYGGEAYGGGVYLSTLYNCTLTGNSSALQGGGGRSAAMYNCTLISNSAPAGGGIYGGSMSNCTLINNSSPGAGGAGGGVANGTTPMYNCTFIGNSAANEGGGAYYSTLYNCLLIGNSTPNYGGGAGECTLYNCTVVGNSAGIGGGGQAWCTVNNSIVYFNAVSSGTASNNHGEVFNYSCTAPFPSGGAGNTAANPMFIDKGSGYGTNHVAGNYRFSGTSPCINTGTNGSWTTTTLDLDGKVRIRYGIVDMGAYECVYNGSIIRVR